MLSILKQEEMVSYNFREGEVKRKEVRSILAGRDHDLGELVHKRGGRCSNLETRGDAQSKL